MCFIKDSIKTVNQSCAINAACNPASNLVCNVTEQLPNTCQCLPYNYWDNSKYVCTAQKTNLVACMYDFECMTTSGLMCTSYACKCSWNYYWSAALSVCGNDFTILN